MDNSILETETLELTLPPTLRRQVLSVPAVPSPPDSSTHFWSSPKTFAGRFANKFVRERLTRRLLLS